ncbi:MAG: hypothetical protein NWR51_00405 [Akkermansiaceae bacterium]|jgi:hypothetical protein|nr:hypothetical protein [Akkermansiaceae bacterium]
MSLAEILEELPAFSMAERQLLIRRAIELDEPGLSDAELSVVKSRLADHEADYSTAVSFEAMKEAVRSGFGK